jgi:hypothetical protein
MSDDFPKNYRGLVIRYLQQKYGHSISIRSAVIHPPIKGGIEIINGREIVSYTGTVRFNILIRSDKNFGFHKMTYAIQDNQITSLEEDHETISNQTG